MLGALAASGKTTGGLGEKAEFVRNLCIGKGWDKLSGSRWASGSTVGPLARFSGGFATASYALNKLEELKEERLD
ncbi:MAG: hypothetical protein LBI39_04455 [Puniceicoccales bacterium]|jgi:hypothetical protein|nr:hypothetical protein [Puniceicoccales bacterium]